MAGSSSGIQELQEELRQGLGLDEVNWLTRDGSVLTFAVKSDKSMDSKLLRKLIHVPNDYCDSPFHPLRQCDYLSFCETDKLSSTNSLKTRKLDEYLQIFHDPNGNLGVESFALNANVLIVLSEANAVLGFGAAGVHLGE